MTKPSEEGSPEATPRVNGSSLAFHSAAPAGVTVLAKMADSASRQRRRDSDPMSRPGGSCKADGISGPRMG